MLYKREKKENRELAFSLTHYLLLFIFLCFTLRNLGSDLHSFVLIGLQFLVFVLDSKEEDYFSYCIFRNKRERKKKKVYNQVFGSFKWI